MGGLDKQTLQEIIGALADFGARRLADPKLLELDDSSGGAFDAQVVDEAGNAYVRLSGYCTAPLPDALDPKLLARLAG
jgi:hypothetical protein